ncbi:MAG: HAMP domain-containing sensor histidine kinase [Desulfatiglandales bacterium]
MNLSRIEISFLKSRVARRVFGLFVFCALLPLLVLSAFSFVFVSGELEQQSRQRLRQVCKAKGFEVYENLLFLETEMNMISSALKQGTPNKITLVPYASDKGAGSRFLTLTKVEADGTVTGILGDPRPLPQMLQPERAHLEEGHTLVMTRPETPHHSVYMAMLIDPEDCASPTLLAEVNPVYLWDVGSESTLPPEVEMVISDRENQVLISSLQAFRPEEQRPHLFSRPRSPGHFEFELEGEKYIAASWELFIKPRFLANSWTIVLCEARSSILSPMNNFKIYFILMVLLTFWIVALLSVVLIRKSLVPIETLRAATDRIGRGEVGTRVEIDSGDEFETLGRSFNEMSMKLEQGQRLLVRSAKMSAFGQMSAGIVHEIGQPMTSLLGMIELILDQPMDEENRRQMEIVQSELLRLRDIIIKFRSFSRAPEGVRDYVDLNQVLEETRSLLEHQLHMKEIRFVMDKGEGLPRVMGERNGLQQVLMNLIINAMDALGNEPAGRGLIEVQSYAQDNRVCFSVADNGPGVPEDIRERIFEPFFTTKAAGEGTGLGLAIILSILHQHQGTIHLESDPGKGTRFTVEIPAA